MRNDFDDMILRVNGWLKTYCDFVILCIFQQRVFRRGPGQTVTACRRHGSRVQLSWSWRPTCCSRCSA